MSADQPPTRELTAQELVDLIRNPSGEPPEARSACGMVKVIRTLPEAFQEALAITLPDTSVTHQEIVRFINEHTDVNVSLSAVQRHRNKRGCIVCLYGAS